MSQRWRVETRLQHVVITLLWVWQTPFNRFPSASFESFFDTNSVFVLTVDRQKRTSQRTVLCFVDVCSAPADTLVVFNPARQKVLRWIYTAVSAMTERSAASPASILRSLKGEYFMFNDIKCTPWCIVGSFEHGVVDLCHCFVCLLLTGYYKPHI